MKRQPFLFLLCIVFLYSCTLSKQIERSARKTVLENADLKAAHIGISIYESATGKYLYNYQGDKYFVPASNTKIPTCYAAMKYLGDSLVGLEYSLSGDELLVEPSGDPSFLQPEYRGQ